LHFWIIIKKTKHERDEIHLKDIVIKDTESTTLPPIQHIEPESHIVKVDLALNPIHLFLSSTNKFSFLDQSESIQIAQKSSYKIFEFVVIMLKKRISIDYLHAVPYSAFPINIFFAYSLEQCTNNGYKISNLY